MPEIKQMIREARPPGVKTFAHVSEKMKASVIFGKTVRRLRQKSGMTQKELAKRVKIHRSYVQKIEAGRVNTRMGVIGRIKSVFRCGWEELFLGCSVSPIQSGAEAPHSMTLARQRK